MGESATDRETRTFGFRTWHAVLVYLGLLTACVATITAWGGDTWSARMSTALAIVGFYGILFAAATTAFTGFLSTLAEDMTSTNLRDFMSGNLRALNLPLLLALNALFAALRPIGPTFPSASGELNGDLDSAAESGLIDDERAGERSREDRPALPGLTAMIGALATVAYGAFHLVIVCPLTYLFYAPGSHFLDVAMSGPRNGPLVPTLEYTDKTGTRRLDVRDVLQTNVAAFRSLSASALSAAAALVLKLIG